MTARANEDIGPQLADMREVVDALISRLHELQRQARQLSILLEEEPSAAERLERLERILDTGRAEAHLRTRITGARLVDQPVPHLMLEHLLPVDIYVALLETIPEEAFFVDCGNGTRELQIPPRLAPIPSIVAWRFLTDVVAALITPALVARFHEQLDAHLHTLVPALPPLADSGVEMGLLESRLVRRAPHAAERDGRTKAWDFLTTVVDFGPLGDRQQATGANAAVTVIGRDLHHLGIVGSLSRTTAEYVTYEFAIGPTAKGRRAVAAHAGDHALRAAGLA